MNKNPSRLAPVHCVIETLEGRTLLSGVAAAFDSGGTAEQSAVVVAAKAVRKVATKTTLAVSAGTLGQPITFIVTVRAAAAAGSPGGTVNIIDHRNVIETITLAPATSTNPRFAFSSGSVTLTQPPGGSAYFFGRHAVSAAFVPTGTFLKSTASKIFTVNKPAYTVLAGGVKIATTVTGSGAEVQAGQTADVLYTGYLASNGHIFDDSINDGGSPYPFTIDVSSVIPGFAEGATGMQVGETRIVKIPPAEGYGANGNLPAIPRNATLIFVLTLESIS